MSKSKVLFIMTGSIACYKACQVISRLVQNNCDVQVAATSAALNFVGNATLEGLTGKPVISDMYAQGNVMDHIHLMRWANAVLVAPATANFINKAAHGVGDDLVQTLFLAHDFKRPLLIAPAMNSSMYSHPATQASLSKLKEMGLEILETASGILACGEEGWGKLLDPDEILNHTLKALQVKSPGKPVQPRIKVLVTAGGTQEPIDTVRVISNLSTGKTGISIAETLFQFGFDVTLLQAHNSRSTEMVSSRHVFTSFANLDEKMKTLLGSEEFTHVIHTAAVSDYSIESLQSSNQTLRPLEVKKLGSDEETITIQLKRNHKIVDRLKDYSTNKKLIVIAFKLTSHAGLEEQKNAVDKLFANSKADFVVHNDLADIDISKGTHRFRLFSQQQSKEINGLTSLSNELLQLLLSKDHL